MGRASGVAAALFCLMLGLPALEAQPAGCTTLRSCCPQFTDLVGDDCKVILWPLGVIPYEFGAAYPEDSRKRVRAVMDRWEQQTGRRITFVPARGEPNRLIINLGSGCSSGLPGADNGRKEINWPAACQFAHELGHVIGLYHEHQRFDRDRYFQLVPSKLLPCDTYGGVVKRCSFKTDANLGEYNTKSVMHYGNEPVYGCYMKMPNGECGPKPDPTAADIITPHDVSNVLELYAKEYSWMPFRSMGRDVGATQPLSAEFVPQIKVVGSPALAVEAGANALHMVVRGSDGQLWHRARSGGEWRAWEPLGGAPDSDPAAAAAFGGIVVAVTLKSGNIGARIFKRTGWGPWIEFPAPTGGAHSAPAVASAGAKAVHLFVRGKAEQLMWLKDAALEGQKYTASDWSDEGGRFVGSPAAIQLQDLHVVVGVASKNLWQWRRPAGDNSKPWSQLGCCIQPGSRPALASFSATEFGLVARGPDDMLQNWFWDKSGWTRARAIGGILSSSPGMAGAVVAGHSTLDVVATGSDLVLKHRSWRR